MKLKALLIGMILVSLSCSGSEDSDIIPPSFSLKILNSSQFDLLQVYIHADDQEYQDTNSVLTQPLKVQESITQDITQRNVRVTVTRETFAGGPLHAYTTIPVLNITKDTQLEYLDDQFRVTEIPSN